MTREDKVALFNTRAEGKTYAEGGEFALQLVCFAEELAEFNEALADFVADPTWEKRGHMIKEWADVQVTLSNFGWFFEFDGEKAFNIISDNNLTKLTDGKIVRREDGKILKPENYVKVNEDDLKGL